jgi:hypothetical protein
MHHVWCIHLDVYIIYISSFIGLYVGNYAYGVHLNLAQHFLFLLFPLLVTKQHGSRECFFSPREDSLVSTKFPQFAPASWKTADSAVIILLLSEVAEVNSRL